MSVLGKRTRSTRSCATFECTTPSIPEIPTQLAPRKRVRRAVPEIFEDAVPALSKASTTAAQAKSDLRKKRAQPIHSSTPSSNASSKRQQNDASLTFDEQKENCMPLQAAISTPSASRFKDALTNGPRTPKQVVRGHSALLTPCTPRTFDAFPRKEQNVYARARQLLTTSSTPTRLIGRDTERQRLHEGLDRSIRARTGLCMYISGPPGTGKSALVQEVLTGFEQNSNVRLSTINCVSLRTATQVFGKLLSDFAPSSSSKKSETSQLRQLFTTSDSMVQYVVMLDEIDNLADAECEILYTLFTWALQPNSCLSLIGIANALDLTDRCLPKLKARCLKPDVLAFMPYTAQQISQIITNKLKTLLSSEDSVAETFVPCMHPLAIQLCGKKIASQTGDLRKAFSLVRRCLEHVEKEVLSKETPSLSSRNFLTDVVNAKSQTTVNKSLGSLTAETAPRATIAHVAKVAASIFQNNNTTSRLACLNLQQKAVLCSIVNREARQQQRNPFVTPSKSTGRLPTVGELYQKYSALCRRDDGLLQPLKDTEFRDVVASLETLGLVYDSKSRSSSLLTPTSSSRGSKSNDERQMVSAVTANEMRTSLCGPGADLLSRLSEDV